MAPQLFKRSLRPASGEEISTQALRPRIKTVIPGSLAEGLGLSAGDHVLSVDNEPVLSTREWPEWLFFKISSPSTRIDYHLSRENKVLTYEGPFLPPGLELEDTLESLAAGYDKHNLPSACAYMMKLFVEEQFARCLQVAREVDGIEEGTPALVFRGACLISQGVGPVLGNKDQLLAEGLRLVDEYAEKYSRQWTTDYAAVGEYALGLQAQAQGDKDKAEECYRGAVEEFVWSFEPAFKALAQLTGLAPETFRPPAASPWIGKQLPKDRRFPWLSSIGKAPGTEVSESLSDCLNALSPGSVLGLILLASYRSCGPCDTQTKNMAVLASRFRKVLPKIRLLTSSREPPYEDQYAGEEWLKRSGLDFNVLYDEEDSLAMSLQAARVPLLCFLDDQGVIIECANELDDGRFWKLVQKAAGSAPSPSWAGLCS